MGAAVVMGVTSCGKTSVGEALAKSLCIQFVEGDSFHPAANIDKMSSGIPLTDEDRWPWRASIGRSLAGQGGIIASCSALKRSYREAIARAAERQVLYVFLCGSRDLLEQRIGDRKGHFMPPSLLESQLATLEVPGPDEPAITIDIAEPIEQLVGRARNFLLERNVRHG